VGEGAPESVVSSAFEFVQDKGKKKSLKSGKRLTQKKKLKWGGYRSGFPPNIKGLKNKGRGGLGWRVRKLGEEKKRVEDGWRSDTKGRKGTQRFISRNPKFGGPQRGGEPSFLIKKRGKGCIRTGG